MRVLILLLLTFGMHASCTRVDEIPVRFIGEQTDVHSLSSFSDKVEHIPLRMRDDFVLGGVSDVRCWDNNWYIFDKRGRNAVFVYDSAGFPLYSYTRRGRAAGEYSRLESFDVSPDFGYVCLVCHENKIIVLDETLNFKILPPSPRAATPSATPSRATARSTPPPCVCSPAGAIWPPAPAPIS